MSEALTAQDLWPLVLKLTHEERVKLARLALRAVAEAAHVSGFVRSSSAADDLSAHQDPMAWEAEGWEEFT